MPILLENLIAFIKAEFFENDTEKLANHLTFLKRGTETHFTVEVPNLANHIIYARYFSEKERCFMTLNFINLAKKKNYVFNYAENSVYNNSYCKDNVCKIYSHYNENSPFSLLNGFRHTAEHYFLGNYKGTEGKPSDFVRAMSTFDSMVEDKAYHFEGSYYSNGNKVKKIPKYVGKMYRRFSKVLNYQSLEQVTEYYVKNIKVDKADMDEFIYQLSIPNLIEGHYNLRLEEIHDDFLDEMKSSLWSMNSLSKYQLEEYRTTYVKGRLFKKGQSFNKEEVFTFSLKGNQCRDRTKMEKSTVYFNDRDVAQQYYLEKRASILKNFDKRMKKGLKALFKGKFQKYIETYNKLKNDQDIKYIESLDNIQNQSVYEVKRGVNQKTEAFKKGIETLKDEVEKAYKVHSTIDNYKKSVEKIFIDTADKIHKNLMEKLDLQQSVSMIEMDFI